jgi:hypothetical protein
MSTGFPFKVLSLEGTLSEMAEYLRRPGVCDIGFLRRIYKRDDGEVGYRCPAEPASSWLAEGGAPDELEGRKCPSKNVSLDSPSNAGRYVAMRSGNQRWLLPGTLALNSLPQDR